MVPLSKKSAYILKQQDKCNLNIAQYFLSNVDIKNSTFFAVILRDYSQGGL